MDVSASLGSPASGALEGTNQIEEGIHGLTLTPHSMEVSDPPVMDTSESITMGSGPPDVSLNNRDIVPAAPDLLSREKMLQSLDTWKKTNLEAGCCPGDIESIYRFFCECLQDNGMINVPDGRFCFLVGKDFISLPDDLHINCLELWDCEKLKFLPKGLKVAIINIFNCRNIDENSFAHELTVDSLHLSYISPDIKTIPSNVKITERLVFNDFEHMTSVHCRFSDCIGEITISHCPSLEFVIPANVKNIECLSIRDCPSIRRLPDHISYGDVDLHNCGIQYCPVGMKVESRLSITDMPIPDVFFHCRISVGVLILKNCHAITRIPSLVAVSKAIFLQRCNELTAVEVRSKELCRVTMRSCPKLQRFLPSVREITEHLRLIDCPQLMNLPGCLGGIHALDVSACPRLVVDLEQLDVGKSCVLDEFRTFYDSEDGSDDNSDIESHYP